MPNTREKLIEMLDDALLSVNWDSHDYPDTDAAADILISNGVTIQDDHHWATEQAYKNGYADGQPKWISVKERLPQENGYYLCVVCTSAVNQRKEYRRMILFWEDNVWIDMSNCFRTRKPTHWMPLPEAPKVDNADRCVSCGEIIPEGRQVCPNCERGVEDA